MHEREVKHQLNFSKVRRSIRLIYIPIVSPEAIPDSYWKLLAEERRIALDDSLHENEMVKVFLAV